MITLIVCHSSENDLTTQVVKVQDTNSGDWTGIYGDLEEDDLPDGRIQKLVDYLGLKYNNLADNLRITSMPSEKEIEVYIPVTN